MDAVGYMERIRQYYLALGYEKPYVWAHYDEVPFTPLARPLAESRLTLMTTADVSLKREDDWPLSDAESTVGKVYALPLATPPERLYSRQESYDRYATHLDDVDAYLPLTALRDFVEAGRIGGLTDDFFNLNRGYSQRLMRETTAPLALAKARAAGAEAVLLVPV